MGCGLACSSDNCHYWEIEFILFFFLSSLVIFEWKKMEWVDNAWNIRNLMGCNVIRVSWLMVLKHCHAICRIIFFFFCCKLSSISVHSPLMYTKDWIPNGNYVYRWLWLNYDLYSKPKILSMFSTQVTILTIFILHSSFYHRLLSSNMLKVRIFIFAIINSKILFHSHIFDSQK